LPALDDLRAALNTAFRVHVDHGVTVEVQLSELDQADGRPGWESFSLLFVGPERPVPQATYLVNHDNLGSFPLFLVPVFTHGPGQGYEAVLNRPAP
jgi:hypothetical protein